MKHNLKAGSRHSTKDNEHGTQAIEHMLQAGFTHPKIKVDEAEESETQKALAVKCMGYWNGAQMNVPASEAMDVSEAAYSLGALARIACDESAEKDSDSQDVKEVVGAMRWLVNFIIGEMDEIEANLPQEQVIEVVDNGKSLSADTWVGAGAEIKALGNGRIGGYAVTYSDQNSPDLSEAHDYFNAKTYLGARNGDGCDVTINHGIPLSDIGPIFEKYADMMLPPVKTKLDEIGLFAETVVDMADEYQRMVYDLAEKKKLRWSTGAVGHLVKRERKSNGSHELKRWIIGEFALTPTAAEPANIVMPLKSYKSLLTKQGDLQSAPDTSEGAEAQSEAKNTEAKSLALELELLELEATY